MERFLDLFEEQVVEGDLSMDEFADEIAKKFGDLFEYADPDLFEVRMHRFMANMYQGRAVRRVCDEALEESK